MQRAAGSSESDCHCAKVFSIQDKAPDYWTWRVLWTYGRPRKLLFSADSCERFLTHNAKNTLRAGDGFPPTNRMCGKGLRVCGTNRSCVPHHPGVALEQRVYPVIAPLSEIS
jgi:hypothetical protein